MPDADALKQNTTQERPANATWKKQRMTQRDISEEAAENEEGKRKEKEKKKEKRPSNAKVPSSKWIVADVTAMFPFTH